MTTECGFCERGRMSEFTPNGTHYTVECPYCHGSGLVGTTEGDGAS